MTSLRCDLWQQRHDTPEKPNKKNATKKHKRKKRTHARTQTSQNQRGYFSYVTFAAATAAVALVIFAANVQISINFYTYRHCHCRFHDQLETVTKFSMESTFKLVSHFVKDARPFYNVDFRSEILPGTNGDVARRPKTDFFSDLWKIRKAAHPVLSVSGLVYPAPLPILSATCFFLYLSLSICL